MGLETIAILSPGDMGHGVGKALVEHGYDVITCLTGRSQRTRDLAAAGGFRDVPSLEEMTLQADLIMSILVPAEAVGVARLVADAMRGCRNVAPIRGLQRGVAKIGLGDGVHHQQCGWRLHRRRDHRRLTGQRSGASNLHVRPARRPHGRA